MIDAQLAELLKEIAERDGGHEPDGNTEEQRRAFDRKVEMMKELATQGYIRLPPGCVLNDTGISHHRYLAAVPNGLTYKGMRAIESTSRDAIAGFRERVTLMSPEAMPKIFISHSSTDHELVELLIDLLRDAVCLRSEDIRCTSIDGYRLPAGADVLQQLRREVLQSQHLISILSPASLRSSYVLFELGARWGSGKDIIPLLAPGCDVDIVEGPLKALNILRSSKGAELHQLVTDIANCFGTTPVSPATYQSKIDRIIKFKPNAEKGNIGRQGGISNPQDHQPGYTSSALPPQSQDDRALLAIWNMDDKEYYQYGYTVQEIATAAGVRIPNCQHSLETLLEKKHVAKRRVAGGKNAECFTLTKAGRDYLVDSGLTN